MAPTRQTIDNTHQFLLDIPFAERALAQHAGARWDGEQKAWVYRGETLPEQLSRYGAPPHSWQRWLEDNHNSRTPVRVVGEPTVRLHPHQRDAAQAIAVAHLGGLPGFLLADDVGLGKTYSAVAGIDKIGSGLNVLVIAPLSVVPHWRRSIDAASRGRNRWCVVNYDRLKSLLMTPESAATAKRTRTKNRRTATQGRSRVIWDVVVLDEAHVLRNPSSQRSAAVRQLVGTGPSGRRPTPAFSLWLSATAGQNPLELSYLAPLLASVTGSKVSDLTDFETWCRDQGIGVKRGSFGSWSWVRDDADLIRMRQLLFDGDPLPGVRRRPTDLANWPEQQRIAWPVELNTEARAGYLQAWEEFCAVRQRAATARQSGKRRLTGSDNPLTALLRFRQKASLLRVPATVDLVEDLLANHRQVAISVEFLETADTLIETLAAHKVTACRIAGADSTTDRERNRAAFQQGQIPVVVFTITEGISLHAGETSSNANDVERITVVHDPRWSAIATAQIEGRCHRDGRNAVAYHCLAADTVEEKVVASTLQRLSDMKTMIGDDTTGLDLLDALGL